MSHAPLLRSSSIALIWACALASLTACGSADEAALDAPRSTVPSSPAGTFTVTSAIDLEVPAVAEPVVTVWSGLGDGPDDPSRFVLDRMIDRLPDGTLKTIAAGAAPYVATYVNGQLSTIAPQLVTGLHGLSAGLIQIAHHVATRETWTIDGAGHATRTITGFAFELAGHTTEVAAEPGAGTATTQVTLAPDGGLTIADHPQALAYGAWLRRGLDLAVVPSVVPDAHDLATALGRLLDCDGLAAIVAARVGIGAPSVYAAACRAAMTWLASEVEAELAAIDDTAMSFALLGDATAVDDDGDGTMDRIAAGSWRGSVHAAGDEPTSEPLGKARFAGDKRR